MKTTIISLFVAFMLLCQTAMASDSWPLGEIGGNTTDAGGAGVRIAVIDTGISTVSISPKRLVQGKNYMDTGADTEDKVGHGTAVASIIVGAEKQGLRGIAPDAVLVPLVCSTLGADGKIVSGSYDLWAQAIRDAVDEFGCKVINLSMGTATDDDALRSAVAYAESRGAVVVSAVGNYNADKPEGLYYPAAYATVIGVGAVTENGEVAAFSQRNTSVALCAPGKNLKVATIRGKTISTFGTSYAAAFVSGTAALLLSLQQDLKPEVIRRILYASAKDLGTAGYDKDSGWGVLQVDTALQFAKQGVRFRDTAEDSWYCGAVRYVTDFGLFGGISDAFFDPNGAMTRGMFATVLGRLDERSYGLLSDKAPSFSDVDSNKYYAKYIAWAKENNIIIGVGNNTFEPERKITREEMAQILCNYLKHRAQDIKFGTANTGSFADRNSVSPWAVNSVDTFTDSV
jgi:subtilisin family serine protease